MKLREVASLLVFLFVAFSFFAANQNNKLENERITAEPEQVLMAQR